MTTSDLIGPQSATEQESSARSQRRFAADSATLIGSRLLITLAAVGTSIVTARALGPEGRGTYTLALLLPGFISTFLNLGIAQAGIRAAASGDWAARTVFGSHLAITGVHMALGAASGVALVVIAGDALAPGVRAEVLLLGIATLPAMLAISYLLPLLVGLQRIKTYGALLLFSSVTSFGGLLLLVSTVGLTVERALGMQLATGLLVFGVTTERIWRSTGAPTMPRYPYVVHAYRFGMGAHAAGLTYFAHTRVILLLVNGHLGTAALGLYTLAMTLAEHVYLLADALGTVLLPRVAADPSGGRRVTPVVFRFALVATAGVAIALAVVATPLVRLLFSSEFDGSVGPLRLLLVAAVLSSGWRVLSNDLMGRGAPWTTAFVNLVALLTSVGVALLLLPRTGLEGAAYASLLSAGAAVVVGALAFRARSEVRLAALVTPTARETALVRRLATLPGLAFRLGLPFAAFLGRAYAWDAFAYRLTRLAAPFLRRGAYYLDGLLLPFHLARWSRRRDEVRRRAEGVLLHRLDLPGATARAVSEAHARGEDFVLGEYDRYGALLPAVDAVPGIPPVAREAFIPRLRGRVLLLARPDGAAVRKQYAGSDARRRWLAEVRALDRLGGAGLATPRLLEIDPAAPSVTVSYLPGTDLEQVLRSQGAAITSEEILLTPGQRRTPEAVEAIYYERGRETVTRLPADFVDALHELIRAVHREGVELYDLNYSNITLHADGRPALQDFDAARVYRRSRSRRFLVERDRDIERLNRGFGTSYLTHGRLSARLAAGDFPASARIYGSAYIGHGLRLGHVWDPAVGVGRWYLLLRRRFRRLRGARILSLGANAGTVELALLRQGIGEIVAYEQEPEYLAQGEFLRAAFEWADNREYPLTFVHADMREAAQELERYDAVMALCSLYYLDEADMRAVASAVGDRVDEWILQCNERAGIGREDDDQYRRASVAFARELLQHAGFDGIRVTAPAGYSRPLVEGARQ